MNKSERVQFILSKLEELYPETPIPLNHSDPYTLLIAVLLSAQCTDVRVNQITPLLFAKANNPTDMLKLSVEEIQNIIRPCGLSPMKSKGIYGHPHSQIGLSMAIEPCQKCGADRKGPKTTNTRRTLE